MPGMNPKQMEKLMHQMGIQSENVSAKRVVIELEEGNLIVEDPQVTQIKMQGQVSFQVAGNVRKEESILKEDVKLIMEKTGCSREQATAALQECGGDIAEAIVKLESKE